MKYAVVSILLKRVWLAPNLKTARLWQKKFAAASAKALNKYAKVTDAKREMRRIKIWPATQLP